MVHRQLPQPAPQEERTRLGLLEVSREMRVIRHPDMANPDDQGGAPAIDRQIASVAGANRAADPKMGRVLLIAQVKAARANLRRLCRRSQLDSSSPIQHRPLCRVHGCHLRSMHRVHGFHRSHPAAGATQAIHPRLGHHHLVLQLYQVGGIRPRLDLLEQLLLAVGDRCQVEVLQLVLGGSQRPRLRG